MSHNRQTDSSGVQCTSYRACIHVSSKMEMVVLHLLLRVHGHPYIFVHFFECYLHFGLQSAKAVGKCPRPRHFANLLVITETLCLMLRPCQSCTFPCQAVHFPCQAVHSMFWHVPPLWTHFMTSPFLPPSLPPSSLPHVQECRGTG